MHVQTLDKSPRHHRGGQVSHLLLTKGQFGAQNLSVTWVEGQPGSRRNSMRTHRKNKSLSSCEDAD